jgi:hypothetical protein
VVVAVAALAVLAGCGDDDGSSALPSATAGSSAASTSAAATSAAPSTSAGSGSSAVPSPAPQAAHEDDIGAKAFGVYFVRVLDYAFDRQDVAPLKAASADSCVLCNQVASSVSRYRKPGYTWRGGRITLKDLTISQPSPSRPVIVANVSISELKVTDPQGRPVPYSEGAHPRAQFLITEEWTDSGWTVTDLKLGS